MIYLDSFVTDLCDEFNYPEIMVDLICNICYYGPKDYDVTGPEHLDFVSLQGNFVKIIPQFFCNSLAGIYNIYLNLISFLLSFNQIDRKFTKHALSIDDLDKMTQMFQDYERIFGKDFHLEFPEKDQCNQILHTIEHNLKERYSACEGNVDTSYASFETCERMFKRGGFFEKVLLTIRELLDTSRESSPWRDTRIVTDTLRQFNDSISTLPFLIQSLKKRDTTQHRLIGANTAEFKKLCEVYEQQRDHPGAFIEFNKILLFSGNKCSLLWEFFRLENQKRLEPNGMATDIWQEFESLMRREDMLHRIERGDFEISTKAYNYLIQLPHEGVQEVTPEQVHFGASFGQGPKEIRFGGSFVQAKPVKTITTEEDTWTVPWYIILILVAILGYVLFV